MNPPMPAMSITQMGDTPNAQMRSAATIGIQMLWRFILAVLAMEKHGAAISATTAGRMPLNIFSM